MRTIAIANRKGGVGKTTTAVNLAAYLGRERPNRVLLVDLDPQGNASKHLGLPPEVIPPDADSATYRVLARGRSLLTEALRTDWGFAFLNAGDDLTVAELKMTTAPSGRGRFVLREAVDELAARGTHEIEHVILDCPPSLGALTHAALIAADVVVAPIALEPLPLDGLHKLMALITMVRKYDNESLRLGAVFATRSNPRARVSQLIAADLSMDGRLNVCATQIRVNTDLAAASYAMKPVLQHAPNSHGAQDYEALTLELQNMGVL